MLGLGNDDDESEEEAVNETWDAMVEDVERAAERYVKKEREPFRFHVFRDDDGAVEQWALLVDKDVAGEPSRVPVVVGAPEGGRSAMWFDYQNRRQSERGETIFEWVEKEEVVPSNTFYAWVADTVEAVAEFNEALDGVDDEAFGNVSPDLPPLYDELAEYEAHALSFFADILLDHRNYSEEQARLIGEAVRRYDVDEETWNKFTGEAFEEDDEPEPTPKNI